MKSTKPEQPLWKTAAMIVDVAMRYDGAMDEQLTGFSLTEDEKIAARGYALTYRQTFGVWPAGIHRLPNTVVEVCFSAAK